MTMAPTEVIITKAQFDPKLRLYLYLRSVGILALSIVGIPMLPVWLFVGWWWAGKYRASIRCELTERRLRVHKGVVFQQNKTIPLEKIQDLGLRHGPVQRALGICSLRIETASQAGPQGAADADLIGIMDVLGFQEMVLAQRDRLEQRQLPQTTISTSKEGESEMTVLVDIRDSLHRMEEYFKGSHEREQDKG